jgi:hypothetical protein
MADEVTHDAEAARAGHILYDIPWPWAGMVMKDGSAMIAIDNEVFKGDTLLQAAEAALAHFAHRPGVLPDGTIVCLDCAEVLEVPGEE